MTVICIDPGHPSEVGVGTRGKRVTEVGICQRVANRLRVLLMGDGYTVVLTKSKEREFVTNRRRADIANAAGSALMVRLHCDAAGGSGFATYYPDRTGVSGGYRGPSPSVIARSSALARPFHAALKAAWSGWAGDRGLKTDRDTAVGARQGALTGSIRSLVPVVLVEMAVLTNPTEEKRVGGPYGEARLAAGLAAAVRAAVPRAKPLARRLAISSW